MQEQLYNDFVTKLLPKIAEGVQITKEYFTDIFSRYTHYLIVQDSIWVALWAVCFILMVWGVVSLYGRYKRTEDEGYINGVIFVGGLAIIFFVLFMFKLSDLVKELYIPEIRIYSELKYLITR